MKENITKLRLFLHFAIISIFIFSGCSNDKSEVKQVANKETLFKLLKSEQTNIDFNNVIYEDPNRTYVVFNPIYNGGGVAIGDVNNDGLLDVFFTGNEVDNKLYINKGDLVFEDITESSGITENEGWHNGATMVDINGDGLLDIYICRGGHVFNENKRKNLLYVNQGDLTFKESAIEYGIDDKGYSFHSSFFDYDNDGDLDLYVINHPNKSFLKIPQYLMGEGGGPYDFKDHLYQNNDGIFTDVTHPAGVYGNFGFGLSLITSDFNDDGFSDIYVANDYTQRDYLFMNNQDGTFTEKLKESTGHISLFSMGADFADINNDGLEDLFVSEMLPDDYKRSKTMMANMSTSAFKNMVKNGMHYQYMHNAMQLNRGNGYFSEISHLSGISKTDWSWSCFLSDFDNDGLRDLFVSNGYRRDVYDKDTAKKRDDYVKENRGVIADLNAFYDLTPVTKSKNFIFKNNGDLKFEKKISEWGFEQASFSNGASVADLDNDGDLDIVVNNMEEEAFIYENTASEKNNNYIKIKLVGPSKNPFGIGAKVKIKSGDLTQVFQQKTTRGYLASSDPNIHFGLGQNSILENIDVTWHDGTKTKIQNVEANQTISINYSDAEKVSEVNNTVTPLFHDVTNTTLGQIKHSENAHDDFKNQVLLPYELSKQGPFISIGDVNGDYLEDFYLGGAHRQSGTIYVQDDEGQFSKLLNKAFENDSKFEDLQSVFFDIDGDNDLDLYVISGGSEAAPNSTQYIDRLYTNDGGGSFTRNVKSIPSLRTSGANISTADYDNDGDIDVFIGGRNVPDKYPSTPQSYLLQNNNGVLTDVTQSNASELGNVGMVTSSIWEDVNNDGNLDLIVVGEWMPISIFINKNGKFSNVTKDMNLENTTGWWNTIHKADIDGDNDIDFIVGNLGENFKFHASPEKPFHIYSDDFDKNGTHDIILAKYEGSDQVPVRGRQCTSEQIPSIADKFETYEDFANANVQQMVNTKSKTAVNKSAQLFSSIILRNNNGKYEVEKLPSLAQLSTTNVILSGDFNSDGNIDIVLAGNLYDTEVETTRADASIGLLLAGQNNKTFKALSHSESGLFLPGNIKDGKAIKIQDKDHFIFTENNGYLKCISLK
ncbi:MAG: VCBS repeat-containing protein [Saprospiraceae bacterium]|nr:VCBS repeat-containing protein [Saprospiraceae bacterium]